MNTETILIVEDEQDLRDALRLTLQGAGFSTLEAENGKEALLLAEERRPNLVLLDIGLPEVNGHHVLREIRRNSWGKDMHVIMLTNADDPENVSHGAALQNDEYLIKSQTDLQTIVKKVKQHLAGYFD